MIRRGGVLMEALTAIMLLSLLLVSTSQIVTAMRRQSRVLTQRTIALQECQNALARVSVLPAEAITPDVLTSVSLPSEVAEILPEGKLEILRIDPEASAEGTQLQATVRWRIAANAELAETSLSLWRFDLASAGAANGGTR